MQSIKILALALLFFPGFIYAQSDKDEISTRLSAIHSEGDFNQTGYSLTQVDSIIYSGIIEQVDAGMLNEEIQIPYNDTKLKYLGFIHPNETNLFDANPISKKNNNTPELDKQLYIFQYGDFYVSLESKTDESILNLYYTMRAINIIQIRYPEIYQKLFTNSMQFATESPQYGNWVNSNKAFWIAFNENPHYIASNNTIFLGAGYFQNSQIGKYRNVSLVNIDAENISGKLSTVGSRPLYNQSSDSDNHLKYLKDGLIESICHEMIHNYIDLSYTYDPTVNTIRQNRGNSNFIYAEEIAVMNTSLTYFIEKGGLNENLISYYYKHTFNYNICLLNEANQLDLYGKVFTKNYAPSDWKRVFKLNLFD